MKQFIQNIIVFHVNLLQNVIIKEGSSIIVLFCGLRGNDISLKVNSYSLAL